MKKFVQLENHSVYSLCEGTIFISELASRAQARGDRFLSLCDTNGFYGLVNFLEACRKARLRPVIGVRVKHRLFDGLLFARNPKGYGAISGFLSDMHLRDDFDPRAGVLGLPGGDCIVVTADRGLLPHLLEKRGDGVYAEINVLKKDYGADLRLAKASGARPVLVSPVYFLRREDYPLHRLLRAIRLNKKLSALLPGETESEFARPPGEGDQPVEERYSFMEDALGNTEAVAEACSFEPASGSPILPRYGGGEADGFALLKRICEENLPKRYPRVTPEVRARLERELGVIREKGFADYFLVVHDFVKRSVYTCGRGSAAASLVAYLLYITHVDPIRHNLFFERFLNEARPDPPDIDVDFPWDTRDEILDYIFRTYGEDHAAMVSNHVTFSVRSSVREVAKVHGMPEGEIGGITRRIGYYYNRDSDDFESYSSARDRTPSPSMRAIYREAVAVNGRPRHLSVHCGGVVITPEPVSSYIPVERAPKGVNIIQLEKDQAEDFGFAKIDVLGNRSLAVVRDAIALVEEHHGRRIRYEEFDPLDDEATVKMLAEGNTIGVFYVESPAMRQLQRKTGRGDYEHLVIHSSIIRPAANRYIREYIARLHGKPWEPLLPEMEETLRETYGIMCYQEDIIKVAIAVAGFTLAEACELRKVISRRNKLERKLELKGLFERNLGRRGVDGEVTARIWDMIESFSGYSFCKPHSASYALLSFKSCYLKAHYPAEFMGAVLKNQGGYYCPLAYISEARRLGLKVEKPDVNASRYEYFGRVDTVYIGFMQIKNLSAALARAIAPERDRNGPYTGVLDFMKRTGAGVADTALLIRGGAFSNVETRSQPQLLYLAHAWRLRREKGAARRAETARRAGGALQTGGARRVEATRRAETARRAEAVGAVRSYEAADGGLFEFDETIVPPPMRETSPDQTIRSELELYGFVVSEHPMERWRKRIGDPGVILGRDLDAHVGRTVRVAGILITAKTVLTVKKDLMQFISFEDETAIFETVFFPETYKTYARGLSHQRPYILTGKVESEFGVASLNVKAVEDAGSRRGGGPGAGPGGGRDG